MSTPTTPFPVFKSVRRQHLLPAKLTILINCFTSLFRPRLLTAMMEHVSGMRGFLSRAYSILLHSSNLSVLKKNKKPSVNLLEPLPMASEAHDVTSEAVKRLVTTVYGLNITYLSLPKSVSASAHAGQGMKHDIAIREPNDNRPLKFT